ncbi:cytosine permease [Oceanobacillus alkalisoli]|uniref:cytosine permease n=1 Tax=Oceanobacillus alkalisoli TaxID=2925113 RepID=UPI001F12239D|nr:cytosine permease [Oceanobacillus alkalisoli]MCF3945014.1 cytosine permease [Oceanobacillus alkalisoli]
MEKFDPEFSRQAVPMGNRNNFWKILSVMLGMTFFSASMLAGGELGLGLTFTQFMLIVLIGNFILGIYTGSLAYISAKTGLSTHLLAKYAFGEKGSHLPSFLLGFTQVGWFGVGVAMFAIPVAKILGWNVFALIFLFGIAMTASALYGMKSLVLLGYIAVPAITILGTYSMFHATEVIGGLQGLVAYEPVTSVSVAAALTICIGSFISAGSLTPDFTRFSKSPRQAVTATVIAFLLGNTLMFIFGAFGAMAYGLAEISEVLFLQGLVIPAIVVLGLNIWTTNDNALYASGLAFANITNMPKKLFVIINGLVGTLFAMWMYSNFVGFLNVLGAAIPSIGAIIIADYFFIRKRKYAEFKAVQFQKVNWIAMIAWAAGVGLAQFAPGISPLNALIGTGIVYILLTKILPQEDFVKGVAMSSDH